MVSSARAAAMAGWLLAGAAAMAHERYAAVETDFVLSPRQFHMAPAQVLAKRDDSCSAGHHPCNDIGSPGATICCADNQYCIINPATPYLAGCCALGSTCNSPCAESQYQCNTTSTLTITSAGHTTTTVTLSPACCPRACTNTAMYLCAPSLGTGCCAFGEQCATGGRCFSTLAPSNTATTATGLQIAPAGCETGQITCAATLGGGCCADTLSCVLLSGSEPRCAQPTTPPSGAVSVVNVGDGDGDGGGGGGLSAGAKAGIAVGVVVGVGVLLGVATWVCLRRRRKGRWGGPGPSEGGESSSRGRGGPRGVVGRVLGGGGGGGQVSGGGGGGGAPSGREMSEENSDLMSRTGLAQDYFGPAPAIGPYSDQEVAHPGASAGTTPSGAERGGVPLQPHEPGDIAVPVEIDSRSREREESRRAPPAALEISPTAAATGAHEEGNDGHERYELYGSDVGQISPTLPSPYAGGRPISPEERPRWG